MNLKYKNNQEAKDKQKKNCIQEMGLNTRKRKEKNSNKKTKKKPKKRNIDYLKKNT